VGGWLAIQYRFDAHPSFVILASHAITLTRVVWEAVLRWAHYIARTWHYVLTYRFAEGPGSRVLTVHADSSLGNGTDGLSYYGVVTGFRGIETGFTGALSTATKKSRLPLDSSGAAELIAIGDGAKSAVGTRILYAEAKRLADLEGATPISLDASVVFLGTPSEKVSFNMRYSAIRYAMLRTLVESDEVKLVKVDTDDMVADGCSKPLEGAAFARFRNYVLGRPEQAASMLPTLAENGATPPQAGVSAAEAARCPVGQEGARIAGHASTEQVAPLDSAEGGW
jgi:hypothetical protein